MSILNKLQESKFRNRFKLTLFDKCYVNDKGIKVIRKHAYDFFDRKLKIKVKNDGRQTPWKGHPVFVAQHATATCCRKCLEKWHGISKKKILNDNELTYCVNMVMMWIKSND
jgi:hypothetical protein